MNLQSFRSVCVAALFVCTLATAEESMPLYKRATAPIPDRVRDLLNRMTVEEKVAQLQGLSNIPVGPGAVNLLKADKLDPEVAKRALGFGLGTFSYTDTPGASGTPAQAAAKRNAIQSWILENTRLGIPILFHGEALHGAMAPGATLFPQAIGLGSTWDRELLHRMFNVVAKESRAVGNPLVLAPVLDLSRDPRYGRVEEMYSEDPYLVSELGLAAIQGLQGEGELIDQDHVIATAKHFIHGQPENGTNVGPNDVSERTMREVFLYPFQRAVQAGHIGAVMPSYNENNGGIPSSANTWLLKDVLRKEWGFAGLTVSDYWAVFRLHSEHHVVADDAAAGVLAFNSGVDMELPNPAGYPALVAAVRTGNVSQKDLDTAVMRVLTAKFKAGLFEHPFADPERATEVVGSRAHAELARKVADEAIVLLKNEGNLLPLDSTKIKTLAVIGPNADKRRTGTYSGTPPYFVTVLDGIRKRAGPDVNIIHAEGCRISEPDNSPAMNGVLPYRAPSEVRDRELIVEAVNTARSADMVVLVLGGNEAVSREAFGDFLGVGMHALGDTDTLHLPGRQDELVREVLKLGKPVVAVLLNGRPYAIEDLAHDVPSVIEGWYLGQETGNAIAGVLFGDVNPSGRLPVTIARNVGQLPVYYYKTPAARLGYVFGPNTPLFPFGFGLSFTNFAYGKPTLDRAQITPRDLAKVSVTVTNTGQRAGDEVVQMYIHHSVSSVVQPILVLRGFKRVHLEPGQSETVTFEVGSEQIAILDRHMQRVVESGPVEVLIGPDSSRVTGVQFTVVAQNNSREH
jgi:beta-glucosidase